MRTLGKWRDAIAAPRGKSRELLDAAAAKHGAEVLLVAVDFSEHRDREKIGMYVYYLAIDEAMRVSPVLDFLPDHDHVSAELYRARAGVSCRSGDLAELRALGADGRIDDMAAAATAAPGGAKAVFAKRAIDYEALFEGPTGDTPMFVTLYQRDGTVKADIFMAGKLEWYRAHLEILGHFLPETLRGSLSDQVSNP